MIKLIQLIRKNYFDNTIELSKLSKTFFLWGIGLVLVYVANIYLIRLIGLQQYGEYTVFMNWVGLAVTLILFGWDGYLVQQIPQLPLTSDGKIRFGHLFRKTLLTFFLLFAILVSILLAVVFIFKSSPMFSVPGVVQLFLLLVFFLTCIGYCKAILKIFHIVTPVQGLEDIVKPFLLLIIVFFFYFGNKPLKLESVYLINSILVFMVALGLYLLMYLKLGKKIDLKDDTCVSKNWVRQCFYFMCIMMGYSFFSRMELLFLGFYSKNEDAAKYQILLRIADLVILPDFLFNYYLPQKFSRYFSDSKMEEAGNLFRYAARTIFLLQTLCLAFVAGIGYYYLQSFRIAGWDMYLLLLVLCSSQLFYSLFGSSNLVLMTSGNEKYSFMALALVLIVEAIANISFISPYGLKAAVYISWISVFLYTLILFFFVRKRLRFESPLVGFHSFRKQSKG